MWLLAKPPLTALLTWAHLFDNISVFVKPQSKAC